MRGENASPVLSPTRAMHVDCTQSELESLRPIPPGAFGDIRICAHWESREASHDIL